MFENRVRMIIFEPNRDEGWLIWIFTICYSSPNINLIRFNVYVSLNSEAEELRFSDLRSVVSAISAVWTVSHLQRGSQAKFFTPVHVTAKIVTELRRYQRVYVCENIECGDSKALWEIVRYANRGLCHHPSNLKLPFASHNSKLHNKIKHNVNKRTWSNRNLVNWQRVSGWFYSPVPTKCGSFHAEATDNSACTHRLKPRINKTKYREWKNCIQMENQGYLKYGNGKIAVGVGPVLKFVRQLSP
jgi:hypothetical protein